MIMHDVAIVDTWHFFLSVMHVCCMGRAHAALTKFRHRNDGEKPYFTCSNVILAVGFNMYYETLILC